MDWVGVSWINPDRFSPIPLGQSNGILLSGCVVGGSTLVGLKSARDSLIQIVRRNYEFAFVALNYMENAFATARRYFTALATIEIELRLWADENALSIKSPVTIRGSSLLVANSPLGCYSMRFWHRQRR